MHVEQLGSWRAVYRYGWGSVRECAGLGEEEVSVCLRLSWQCRKTDRRETANLVYVACSVCKVSKCLAAVLSIVMLGIV